MFSTMGLWEPHFKLNVFFRCFCRMFHFFLVTLPETNIYPFPKALLKMIFLFPFGGICDLSLQRRIPMLKWE